MLLQAEMVRRLFKPDQLDYKTCNKRQKPKTDIIRQSTANQPMVGFHIPLTGSASESPGHGGMEIQMNFSG